MRISTQLSAIAASLVALADIASALPSTILAPASHHHRHADFHLRRNVRKILRRDVPCQPGAVIGVPDGGPSIHIINKTPNPRLIQVTPAADLPSAYSGLINICPNSDSTFWPGEGFSGNLADMVLQSDPKVAPVHGAMLEINVTPGAVWWDVSLTRGFSNMVAGPIGQEPQGEADYLKKATDAWWTEAFDYRQWLNTDNWYINADGTGVTHLNMDAGEKYGPEDPRYTGVLDLLQVKAKFNAYIARGTPWGTTVADKMADVFSKQAVRGQGSSTTQSNFDMNLV